MVKKSIAAFTLGAFLILTWSCLVPVKSTKVVPATEVSQGNVGVPILSVQKKTGERIVFAKETPGQYKEDSVIGNIWIHREFERSQVESIKTNESGRVIGVITNDGKPYGLRSAKVEGDKISGLYFDTVTIPVSDLDVVWIRKPHSGKEMLANFAIVIAATAGILALMISSMHPSVGF